MKENEKRQRKNEIINAIKIGLMIGMMMGGFYTTYCLIWRAVGLPLVEWALWVLMGLAALTEWGFIRWLQD